MILRMQKNFGLWLISIKHYLSMCLLLSSPDRLPYSQHAIAFNLITYLLVGTLMVNDNNSYANISIQIFLQFGLMGLIAYAGLKWKQQLDRFTQTFSALTGVTVIIDTLAIPLYRTIAFGPEGQENTLLLLTLAIMIWNLAVMSLILKRSFEITTLVSAILAFNYFVIYQVFVFRLYA